MATDVSAGLNSRADVRQHPFRPHRILPGLILVAVTTGAALVCALWFHDTPQILSGPGDYLTNAGRLTGLLAGYAVIIQLWLMARIPWFEHGVGADRLARWHSFGGRYTVALIAAHFIFITLGYAVTDQINPVTELWELIRYQPDILMAVVAAGIFVGIGVISIRAARSRLRYETWYHLHFYTYLAIALAFSHQFAVGSDFVDNLPARILWGAMYAITAAVLIWYRFLAPVRSLARHRLTVHAVHPESPGVVSVVFAGMNLDEMAARPGQFFRWRFLTRSGWWQSHPYSLSAPISPPFLRITIKSLGDHSDEVQDLRPGTRVIAEGPFGAFTDARRTRTKILLIGGGVGITPLRALFETIPAAPGELTLLYRANRSEELLFRGELEHIAAERGAALKYLLGPPGGPDEPLTAGHLAALVPDLRRHDVYLCGPPGMTRASISALRAAGVKRRNIHSELFEF